MDTKTLKAESRKITGRKVKSLREGGLVPANIYGKDVKSESVQVDLKEFEKVYQSAGSTQIVELLIGKDKKPVLVHNIQKNPVTSTPIHIDFLQVNLKEKVTAKIVVEVTGESEAQKLAVGTPVQYINEIEVEALPGDLPEKFSVDVSALSEVDQAIKVSDLKVDAKKLDLKVDPEAILVKIEPPQKIEEVAPPPPVEGEVPAEGVVPAEGEDGVAAGEAPAEGGNETKAPEEGKKE